MKDLEPGYIVSVPQMDGLYVVLRVDRDKGEAVLLSRDGQKRIVRGIALKSVQVLPEQMLAWRNEWRLFAPRSKKRCADGKQRNAQAAMD